MRHIAYVVAGLGMAVTLSGPFANNADAQMRTGRGEYYSGIQRKPWPSYLYFWITGRDDETAYRGSGSKDASAGKQQPRNSRKYLAR